MKLCLLISKILLTKRRWILYSFYKLLITFDKPNEGEWKSIYEEEYYEYIKSKQEDDDDYPSYNEFISRDYFLFSVLGGVRGDNPSIAADRGLPSDISCVVQSEITMYLFIPL